MAGRAPASAPSGTPAASASACRSYQFAEANHVSKSRVGVEPRETPTPPRCGRLALPACGPKCELTAPLSLAQVDARTHMGGQNPRSEHHCTLCTLSLGPNRRPAVSMAESLIVNPDMKIDLSLLRLRHQDLSVPRRRESRRAGVTGRTRLEARFRDCRFSPSGRASIRRQPRAATHRERNCTPGSLRVGPISSGAVSRGQTRLSTGSSAGMTHKGKQ